MTMPRTFDAAAAVTALLAPLEALTRGFQLPDIDDADDATPLAPVADVALRQGVRIGALTLTIRYEDGSHLTDVPPTRRLPNAPHWFLGMANLDGALIPVFDLAGVLGADDDDAPARTDAKPMLLVLALGDDAAGIVIDGLPQRLRLAAADRIDAPAPAALAGCIGASWWTAGHAWLDLQADALLQHLRERLAVDAA